MVPMSTATGCCTSLLERTFTDVTPQKGDNGNYQILQTLTITLGFACINTPSD